MISQPALSTVAETSFGGKPYRSLLWVLVGLIVLNIFCGGLFTWVVMYPAPAQYYATTINARISPLVPLDQPNMPPSTLLQWASMAAVAVYTYDFVGYIGEINALQEYFTPAGWKQFISVLQASQNLQEIIKQKLIVSAVTTGAPVIIEQGIMNGVYMWKVQMPLLITYQSASETRQQRIMVNLTIERLSPRRSPRGIGIASFRASGG